MERRNFIRLLIGVTIGVPIAVEGVTFGTLFYERLTGNTGERERAEAGVGDGQELLPGTEPRETITELAIDATSESAWTYSLAVEIENSTEETYRLKVGPLSLADGSTVGDTISSDTLEPGATTTLEASWSIPSGSTVDAIWVGGKTGDDSVTELIALERLDPPE